MLIAEQERRERIEINVGGRVKAMTFSSSGEYIFSGCDEGVQVWRVEERERTAMMNTKSSSYVLCLALSKDGKLIAAGGYSVVNVWDTETHEQILEHELASSEVNAVDFSPDASRLLWAWAKEVAIWDMGTGKQLQTLNHDVEVRAAKYSPQGDHIATGTPNSVRVFDSSDGRLLQEIKVSVISYYNFSLLWSNRNNHLFVAANNKIREVKASTGSVVSECQVSDTGYGSRIALPKHEEFIVHSKGRTVCFWDTATHTQLGVIQHTEEIRSIALSPDDRFIALGSENGKISLESLSHINVGIMIVMLDHGLSE